MAREKRPPKHDSSLDLSSNRHCPATQSFFPSPRFDSKREEKRASRPLLIIAIKNSKSAPVIHTIRFCLSEMKEDWLRSSGGKMTYEEQLMMIQYDRTKYDRVMSNSSIFTRNMVDWGSWKYVIVYRNVCLWVIKGILLPVCVNLQGWVKCFLASWRGCRIHRLHLSRGVSIPQRMSWNDSKHSDNEFQVL